MLDAVLATVTLKRWVQISSPGVNSGTDHNGTDESAEVTAEGIDGFALTKVESERLVCDYIRDRPLPAVVLRPGFIYGPRDRTVVPRLIEKLEANKFVYLGR